jgi:hypothetical protein
MGSIIANAVNTKGDQNIKTLVTFGMFNRKFDNNLMKYANE